MKFILVIAVACFSISASAQSLFDQRNDAAEAATEAEYHQLYSERSQDVLNQMQEKLQILAASHGGITNFNFSCSPGSCVSGSTFIGYGSFETADGFLGCKIPLVAFDFANCAGPKLTKCPSYNPIAECLDSAGNRSFLATSLARSTKRPANRSQAKPRAKIRSKRK